MNVLMTIRAGIFFVAGLSTIIFRVQLIKFKNSMLEKLHYEVKVKDERKDYIFTGIIFIIVSLILFASAV